MDPHEVVDLVIDLEDEVNNGGFHQYFNNSSGDKTAETIEALEAMGAPIVADILRRAAFKFPGHMPPNDRTQRLEVLWSNFPRATEFKELDTQFFAYPEDLSGLIAAYKRRFPDSFSE
jgi:hypothetical protein